MFNLNLLRRKESFISILWKIFYRTTGSSKISKISKDRRGQENVDCIIEIN